MESSSVIAPNYTFSNKMKECLSPVVSKVRFISEKYSRTWNWMTAVSLKQLWCITSQEQASKVFCSPFPNLLWQMCTIRRKGSILFHWGHPMSTEDTKTQHKSSNIDIDLNPTSYINSCWLKLVYFTDISTKAHCIKMHNPKVLAKREFKY